MKRRWIAFLTVAVMLISVFALGACGGKKGGNGDVNGGDVNGGNTETPVAKDDVVFKQTSLSVEAGEVGDIEITGSATAYVSSKPDVATVALDGADRLKITARAEGTARISALDKQGDPIDGARCNLTVTQKLELTMPASAETAVNVPFAIPYTVKGSGATFTHKLTFADSGEPVPETQVKVEKSADAVPVYTLTSNVEKELTFTLTAKKNKTGETKTASCNVRFVDFFQDKYYNYEYFRFDTEPACDPEKFEAVKGVIPENVRKKIDELRAEIAADKGEQGGEEGGEEGGSGDATEEQRAMARNIRATSDDIAAGYTVYLSDAVLNGQKVLPANLVIPAEYNGKPVTKIGSDFMKAFAEYRGEPKSLDPEDKWEKPYESYAGFTAKTVFIPNTVIEIGERAFAETPVTGVVVQENSALQTVSIHAFHRAANLAAFNFATCTSLKTIGSNAFTDNAFKNIFIPKSVTVIGHGAFAQIPNDAFRNNHQTLKTVEFEEDSDPANAVTVYGAKGENGALDQENGAFAYNLALQSVRLCNIKRVQTNMFAQAWSLSDVYVDQNTSGYAFSPYQYDLTGYEQYEVQPEIDFKKDGTLYGAGNYLDHHMNWGNPWMFSLAENGKAALTIDNAMIEGVNALDFCNMKYDSRGLLGFFNGGEANADGAHCFRFATLYIKDGLTPSVYVQSLYEKQSASEKEGYAKWTLKTK